MNQRYKDQQEESEKPGGGLDIDIPDVSAMLQSLDAELVSREAIAAEHQEQMDKEDEEVKKSNGKKKARQKPKGGTICFCGNPNCRIGEFVQIQEGE